MLRKSAPADTGVIMMRIFEQSKRTPSYIERLVNLWERSVRHTHLFLSEQEIEAIKSYVPQGLEAVSHLIVAEREENHPVAFMGITGETLEMLFLSPEERGKGLGKRLLQYGIAHHSIQTLAVNEQNPQARGFYERMGFQVERRTVCDEQGNPYPLLYMRRRYIPSVEMRG